MEEAHVWYGSYGFKYPPNGKIGQYLANAVFFFPHLVHPIVHYPICQNQLGIFFVIPVRGVTGNTPPFRGFGLWNPERWLICPVLRGVRLGCWKIEKEHTASLVLRLGPRFCSVFSFSPCRELLLWPSVAFGFPFGYQKLLCLSVWFLASVALVVSWFLCHRTTCCCFPFFKGWSGALCPNARFRTTKSALAAKLLS